MTDEEINLLEIGKRITERRKKLGMTQEMLAEKGDLTPQFVSYAESGKRAMRGEIVDKDLLILSDKMRKLSPEMLRIVENIIDECVKI